MNRADSHDSVALSSPARAASANASSGARSVAEHVDARYGHEPPPPNKIEVGSAAEARAVELLVAKGYTIVERNFRTKLGELDIVARDGTTLVFVEVRSRRAAKFGSAVEAVGWRKQRRVTRMAIQYLQWRKPRFVSSRFDVIGVTGDEIVHIRDAWRLTR